MNRRRNRALDPEATLAAAVEMFNAWDLKATLGFPGARVSIGSGIGLLIDKERQYFSVDLVDLETDDVLEGNVPLMVPFSAPAELLADAVILHLRLLAHLFRPKPN